MMSFILPCRLPVIALSLLLFTGMVLTGCGDDKDKGKKADAKQQTAQQSQTPPTIKVVKVEPVDIPYFAEYAASIEAKQSVDIRARVAGYLLERHFEEGSLVKEGELLFTIDPREYQENLKQAQSKLQGDQATLDKARVDLKRFSELYEKGAVSREEYDTKNTNVKEYEAMVDQDKAAVKQAELDLGYTMITAPITGLIGRALAQNGDLVGKGENTLLATITTVDPVYVNFSISETDYLSFMHYIENGGPQPEIKLLLKLSDDSIYKHQGTINMVDPSVDPKTGTLGIRATFPNPLGMLKPGQFAHLFMAVNLNKKAILIPQRAVMDVQGMSMCLVADASGKVSSRKITLGQDIYELIGVTEGLQSGDLVLEEGLQKIKNGDVITPEITEIDMTTLHKAIVAEEDGEDVAGKNAELMQQNATAPQASDTKAGAAQ